jgi:hypothetical protein
MELTRDINKEHHEHHQIMLMILKVVDVSNKDSLVCLKYSINNIKYLHFLQIPFYFYFILISFYPFFFFFQFNGHLFQFNTHWYNTKAFHPFWFYLMSIMVFMHSPILFYFDFNFNFSITHLFISIGCLLVFTHSQFTYVWR